MNKSISIRLTAALLFITMLSCSLFISPRIHVYDSPYPVEDVLRAVDDFKDEWRETYTHDLSWILRDINVVFYGKSLEEWNTAGCYRGYTDPYTFEEINVGYVEGIEFPIHKTTIWHELTHVTLYWLYGDPDRDHEQGKGPWKSHHTELIRRLKLRYRTQ